MSFCEPRSCPGALSSLRPLWPPTSISQMMYELKDRLPYHNNGMILCGCMIAKTSNISDMDLELGIECIKTLSDIIIDKNDNLSKVEKEVKKRWLREFLDIWKKYMKEEIKKVIELKKHVIIGK